MQFLLLLIFGTGTGGPTPPPPPPPMGPPPPVGDVVPVDSGIVILIAAALALGIYSVLQRRRITKA